MSNESQITITFPEGSVLTATATDTPSTSTGFSVKAQGTGSFTGLSYTVSAHTKGTLEAKIKVMAITSEDVKKLNDLVLSMVNASTQKEFKEYEKTHASANLSIWSFWSAGASASYDKTTENMQKSGLNEEQITTIINKMFEIAKSQSSVKLKFEIDNSQNDYSVSGDLQLYTRLPS
ncbi:hypothetical protein [Acinetobacter sp. NyZ410]|uniref:hypothetical protein n=1 Tax=Acinetobacter sp. NyZ410 TaxID=2929509 RepID=UPI001FBAFAEE|nr:hypothetical protein [Acinetobacter sp. NyZ410]UOH20736.1 hypothetical protein MTO68_11460 [Acinetobacter sp. NyZ410]